METNTGAPAQTTRDGESSQQQAQNESRNATDESARNEQSNEDDLESLDDVARLRDIIREMRRGERRRNEGYNSLRQQHQEAQQRLEQITRQQQQSAPLEDRLKTLEKDLEERNNKIARMEQERKDERTNADIIAAARRLNAADPEDVVRLIERDDLQVNDDGAATNAEAVVRALLKRKPHLVTRTSGTVDGGTRGAPGRSGTNMNDILRSARRGRVVEAKE